MYIPPVTTIVLYLIALGAIFANIHWWHKFKDVECVKDKVSDMKGSYGVNAVFATLMIVGPILYYFLAYKKQTVPSEYYPEYYSS